MGMRYRRPNRRKHKPYSTRTQLMALSFGVGFLLAPFTYGISLLLPAASAIALYRSA